MLKRYALFQALAINNIVAWSMRLDDQKCSAHDGSPINLDELEADCGELEMDVAIDQIERIRGYLRDKVDRPTLVQGLNELRSRILAHLQSKDFFFVPSSRAKYYERPFDDFGQEVVDKFWNEAGSDMEEAGKSLALGRSTASVYHLVLVLEVALRKLAALLGTNYAPAWDGYIKAVRRRLETPWKDRPEEWRRDEAAYRDLLNDLEALKYSIRNPSMHPGQKYGVDEAVLIHGNMCRFMKHVTTLLPSPHQEA